METMKIFKLILLLACSIFCFNTILSQNINNIDYKPLDKDFLLLTEEMSEYESNDEKTIKLALKGLKKYDDASIRYNLIFWKLSFHYANLGKYQECLEVLKKGQDEGLFYYLGTTNREYPPYRKELKKLDGYETFRIRNEELKNLANETRNTEFMVQLPNNYDQNRTYPLMFIMHGGIGSIAGLQYSYFSEKLQTDFIVVFTQGAKQFGSYTRGYDRENWQNSILNIYQQITSNYAVDTTQVILAGPSAGGYRSIELGLNNIIPSKGLLLSFAVNPRVWDSTLYKNSAERGLKVALLCGENDWAIEQQKKLGYWFDKYGIKNRFVVFPEEGHNFPENWTHYLDTSLDFILKDD